MSSSFQEGEGNAIPPFFTIHIDDKGNKSVEIFPHRLIDFCSKKLGYYNYSDFDGKPLLVKLSRNSIIEESRPEELKQELKDYIIHVVKEEILYEEFAKKNWVNETIIDLLERVSSADFKTKKNKAYLYFNNGILIVTENKAELIKYEDFKGVIWKKQIINREFVSNPNFKNSVFNQFLKNICNNTLERYLSLCSILGFLIHPYKDPGFSKAVILLDEKVDFSGKANGGTGKSLIALAIQQIIPIVHKDGKNFNSKETFVFDDIRPYHKLVYFDDVKMNFSFENFYSMITSSLKVNRKYRDSFTIPPHLTPKLLISSNYMVRGTGGDADERRRIEFEISPYYSKDHTPIHEFKQIFFEDWDISEWNLFDNLMVCFLQYYIMDGVIEPPKINIKENRLILVTDAEFVIFMDHTIQKNTPYDKAVLIEQFRNLCPANKFISSMAFKKWIDEWAEHRGYKINHYKSNGKAIFICYF